MSNTLAQIQVAALQAVSKSIREHARNMRMDAYGEPLQYHRDVDAQDKFTAMADALEQSAMDIQAEARADALVPRGLSG